MSRAPDGAVDVHGVQEEYFYLMVHPCACGGAWQTETQDIDPSGPGVVHRVTGRCSRCGARRTFDFRLPAEGGPGAPIRQVNPTAEPSRALDAAEWLDLARFYLERIERLADPVAKAQSLLDARQCLEEALKFYGPQDDGPPPSALWSEASRRKAADAPETFRRATLEAMLDRLPPLDRLRRADALDQKAFEKAVRQEVRRRRRPWWQFWKRGPTD